MDVPAPQAKSEEKGREDLAATVVAASAAAARNLPIDLLLLVVLLGLVGRFVLFRWARRADRAGGRGLIDGSVAHTRADRAAGAIRMRGAHARTAGSSHPHTCLPTNRSRTAWWLMRRSPWVEIRRGDGPWRWLYPSPKQQASGGLIG